MLSLDRLAGYFKKNDAFFRDLGMELVELEEGRCVVQMPLDDRHANGMGVAHGAATFALADAAFAILSNATGRYRTNAQSSISFVAPGRVSPLRAEARIVRQGGRLGVYEGRITDGAGTLVAVVTVTGYDTGAVLPLN